jgi:hypothetical protein
LLRLIFGFRQDDAPINIQFLNGEIVISDRRRLIELIV